MEKIYQKIWQLAKPYYEKGRVYDIDQVEWMWKKANQLIEKVGIDRRIFIPLIILHDVGYSAVDEKNPDIKDKNSKKTHLVEGVKIVQKILEQVNYDSELTKKIVYYVSVHDNWVFGDDTPFKKSKEMALFNDLDFLYAQSTLEVFKLHGESMGKKLDEMYDFWLNDEKLIKRPFCCQETKEMFKKQMKERKKEL